MSYIGGASPFPFEIGGGPSSPHAYYDALKNAVGIGGAAADGTIEADWRMSQARGLRALYMADRAVAQAWPYLATDYLEVYEAMLNLNPGNLSEHERRKQILSKYTGGIDASFDAIEADLQAIDADFSLVDLAREDSKHTVHGRGFEDENPSDPAACGPAFGGGREATNYPNYSTEFFTIVRYDIAPGYPSAAALRNVAEAEKLLSKVLPAWCNWWIFMGAAGFHLDIDLLDAGAFSP
jgi:hypothetical protein